MSRRGQPGLKAGESVRYSIMEKVIVKLELPIEGKPAFVWEYSKDKAESIEDTKAISKAMASGEETPADYLVKAFNYGHDLLLRASERSKANKASQGPEKEIAKAIKMMVETVGFTEEAAREIVINQRKAAGKPV
jgi:hypothetical protein